MKRILTIIAAALALTGCAPKETKVTSMENPVIEAMMARRSIRHFTDAPVEREKLELLAKCGINAPNARNAQEWELRVIDSKAYMDEVTDLMREIAPNFINNDDPKYRNGFRNASALFAIACPDDPRDMALQNVGLMEENICLAAHSLGLGTCILGSQAIFISRTPEAKPFLDRLQFSEGYTLRAFIAVGYPDEAPAAKPRDESKVKFID